MFLKERTRSFFGNNGPIVNVKSSVSIRLHGVVLVDGTRISTEGVETEE